MRFFPFFSLLPYFWDSEITFDIGIKLPKRFGVINDEWNYHWELRDLDGNIIKQGNDTKQGDGAIKITNIGFRRKLTYYSSGKGRAIVLGTLHPHKEYMLYVDFTTKNNLKTDTYLMASFTVDDRSSYQMQLFLILFTIFMTILVGILAKSCGVPT